MTTISERQRSILFQIVETHIETAMPVGSKVLRDRYHLKYSSATLRNEMGALSHEGYLTQPHTSSGRIPTDEGYRHYVNQIVSAEENQNPEYKDIEGSLIDYSQEVDEPEFFVEGISEWLSRLTRETSIIYLTNPFNSLVRHTRLGIQDRRFFFAGFELHFRKA
jgi:heat-inducible transcriptional repressor